MVQAYQLLMEKGQAGEAYNIASGVAHSMQSIVDRLLHLAGMKAEIRADTSQLRAADSAVIRGDAGRIRRELGWSPRFNLDQMLRDTLQYWRQTIEEPQP